MKRILTLLTAFVALTACRIEEAEYYDPTDSGLFMFRVANQHLSGEAAVAARVMLFDLYYSAPEEEREAIHDRYFYSSRIVGKGNEWRIIDSSRELVIYTDGQPLSTVGAAWRYIDSFQQYAGGDLPAIVCRADDSGISYDLHLPNGGGELSFATVYYSQPQVGGTTRYWCELALSGSGACSTIKEFETVAYEIVEPLRYVSDEPWRFDEGELRLTAETGEGVLEVRAEWVDDHCVRIRRGIYENTYFYG